VERLLRAAGLPAPEARAAEAELPGGVRWLRKPLAGAAGHGIGFAERRRRRPNSRRPPAHYYQRFIPGPSMSAVYVRARGQVRLVGVTEQLIGERWLNAPPFRYAGNVGPLAVADDLRNDLARIGRVLGDGCDLVGLFGVDFIQHAGRPWVVEVNPRYPASVEVLELATGIRAISLHRSAFDAGGLPGSCGPSEFPVVGKAILYAPSRLVVPSFDPRYLADVPAPGEVVEAGWPVLTVLAGAGTRDECRTVLRDRVRRVETLLLEGGRPHSIEP
jgi:uncharacterized protein